MALVWPKILLCGDSITQLGWEEGGWVRLLADKLVRKADIVNRGFSGYNVRMLKSILPQFVTKENVKEVATVVIFMGANDSNDQEHNPGQAVPVEEFGHLLGEIVDHFVDSGLENTAEKIILISPPPVDSPKWHKVLQEMNGDENVPVCPKSQELTQIFADKCAQVASNSGVTFVHLFNEMMASKTLSLEDAFSDGLHLSKMGNKFFYDLVEPLIEEKTKHLDIMFPDWKQMDNKNTDKSVNQWLQSRK